MKWGHDPAHVLALPEGQQAFYFAAAVKDLEEQAQQPAGT